MPNYNNSERSQIDWSTAFDLIKFNKNRNERKKLRKSFRDGNAQFTKSETEILTKANWINENKKQLDNMGILSTAFEK